MRLMPASVVKGWVGLVYERETKRSVRMKERQDAASHAKENVCVLNARVFGMEEV